MYTPDQFRENRSDVLHDAMRSIGFATLVTQGLEANHLPLLLAGNVLSGHVARANPVWKQGEGPALAIFLGEHFYVTPSWYPTKIETGKAVPTWNYVTVHARGTIRWIQDADWLKAHVTALTAMHENKRVEPWAVSEVWLMGHADSPHVVDVTDVFERKLAALRAHASQTAHLGDDLETMLRGWGSRVAHGAGLGEGRLAESFKVVPTG